MLAVAGLVWPVCADISARKAAAYCYSERQQGPTLVPTRGRFRLVRSLKVLSTVTVCFILYTFLSYGYQQLLWDGVVPVVEEGEDTVSAALFDLLYAIFRTLLNFGAPLLAIFVASNTLLALPATLLDPTGKCWGFASLLRSWHLARGARWQMVGYLMLTLAGNVLCFAAPTYIVEAIATPMFNPGNFWYLADHAGLPSVVTGIIFLLGMLEKSAAALMGPGARWCSAFLGLTASTAYFQVLWVVAYLEALRRLELARPPETAQQNVGTGASTSAFTSATSH